MARTYSEREIAQLLARAAERQQAAPSAETPGLTLDEIERVAAEAGLDPSHLRAAAAELDAGTHARTGKPGTFHIERWVEAPLTDTGWEEAVAALRAHFGPSAMQNTGVSPAPDTARIGAAHEWTHTTHSSGIRTVVQISPREGRTRVRLTQTEMVALTDRANAVVSAGLVSFLVALVGAIALHAGGVSAAPIWTAAVLLFVVGTWGGGLLATPRFRRSREKRAASAAEAVEVAARCVEDAARLTNSAAATEPTPRLNLDALPDEASGDAADAERAPAQTRVRL